MSYCQIIRAIRNLCTNSTGYYILRQNTLKLKCLILKEPFNYSRSFSSQPNTEPKANIPKYEDVRSQINSLLQEDSNLKIDNTVRAFHYCGKASPGLSINQRRTLTKEIWESLGDFTNASTCHAYIQACIENDESVNHVEYLSHIKYKPNLETFKLLLESACNVGDKYLALNMLEVMKNENHPADIDVFNLLILAYSISGGYNAAKSILDMMKSAQVKETNITNYNILRGVATFNKSVEFIDVLENYNFAFNPEWFLDVVRRLGMENSSQNIVKFIKKFERLDISRHLNNNIVNFCKQFILQERPNIAFEIYCLLIEPLDEDYGMSLLENMLQHHTPIEIVINFAKQLMNNKLNPRALQLITEFSLRNKYVENALALFQEFDHLKPHYFWPLLIEKSKENGQLGLFEVIKIMQKLKVPVDEDTLYFYVVPNCDLSDPILLINNLKALNFTAKEAFTPIMAALLIGNNVTSCADLCNHYDVSIDGQRLMKPLINFYKKSRHFDTTLLILQRICETNSLATDWTGLFLFQIIKGPKNRSDFQDYINLLKMIKSVQLTITTSSFDNIMTYIQGRTRDPINPDVLKHVKVALDDLTDLTKQEMDYIEHPRNMNVKDLECHLIELIAKQMDTRGVLRKLIQEYSRFGNHERLVELREIYRNSGYLETAGMKGSAMNSFIITELVDDAMNTYNEIKREHSNFNIDGFKIIDLANLLVKKNRFDGAMDLLRMETANIRPSAAIERNCWRLLSSCSNSEQVEVLFKHLTENNVCKISNVMLGPRIKIHLKSENLVAAVAVFKQCVELHKCTPLQLELLTKIVQRQEAQAFLHEVVTLIASVHGAAAARISLLAALAENGYEKPLTKFLMENGTIPSKLVQSRCDRWITENKLAPLLTLLKSVERLPTSIMDKTIVQNAILKLHTAKQDCESALQFYEQLRSKDMEINNEFSENLRSLLKRCNYTVPNSLDT